MENIIVDRQSTAYSPEPIKLGHYVLGHCFKEEQVAGGIKLIDSGAGQTRKHLDG